ncbi:MAG: hypothetical protein FD180_2504 [Planctomycetota bacterium]|nr:MAG: hypothetical protein FD180_2504 [Planctomycetota bacterium]
MRLPTLALALALVHPAIADPPPISDAGPRLSDLLERGPSHRRELLDEVRRAKTAGDPNGAVPLVEALIALADGRALEASEYARQAADAAAIDFGDRDRARANLDSDRTPAPAPSRTRALHELVDVLLAWGEEWEWRGKRDRAKSGYGAAAGLASHLVDSALSIEEALYFANTRYRAHHRLAGLALRAGDETEFASQAASAAKAHLARTALAAAPAPATREEWDRFIDSGPMACVRESPKPPEDAVKGLLEAPRIFCGKSPSALLLPALDDRLGARALPLRWDAALALLPHAKEIAPALKKWLKATENPAVGLALLSRAGESVTVAEETLDDPWAARACCDENALERAFERLPKSRRVAVSFRLNDLRGEDEVDLGK